MRETSHSPSKGLRLGAMLLVVSLFAACAWSCAQESSPKPASPQASDAPSTGPAASKAEAAPSPPSLPTDPRQAQIQADTRKLLKLSQELKAEVAKSSKDTLSLTVIKKAEEVERLAKTLKEEMGKR